MLALGLDFLSAYGEAHLRFDGPRAVLTLGAG